MQSIFQFNFPFILFYTLALFPIITRLLNSILILYSNKLLFPIHLPFTQSRSSSLLRSNSLLAFPSSSFSRVLLLAAEYFRHYTTFSVIFASRLGNAPRFFFFVYHSQKSKLTPVDFRRDNSASSAVSRATLLTI